MPKKEPPEVKQDFSVRFLTLFATTALVSAFFIYVFSELSAYQSRKSLQCRIEVTPNMIGLPLLRKAAEIEVDGARIASFFVATAIIENTGRDSVVDVDVVLTSNDNGLRFSPQAEVAYEPRQLEILKPLTEASKPADGLSYRASLRRIDSGHVVRIAVPATSSSSLDLANVDLLVTAPDAIVKLKDNRKPNWIDRVIAHAGTPFVYFVVVAVGSVISALASRRMRA